MKVTYKKELVCLCMLYYERKRAYEIHLIAE